MPKTKYLHEAFDIKLGDKFQVEGGSVVWEVFWITITNGEHEFTLYDPVNVRYLKILYSDFDDLKLFRKEKKD